MRGEEAMRDVIYVSKSGIERKKGPLRIAYVAGEPQQVGARDEKDNAPR